MLIGISVSLFLNLNFCSDPSPQSAYANEAPPVNGQYHFVDNGAGGGARKAAAGTGFKGFLRRNVIWASLLALLVLAAVGVGLGVGLSKGLNKSNKVATSGNNAAAGDTTGGSTSGTKGGATGSNGNTSAAITPYEFWNYADPQAKIIGVSLGGWLVLERWMNEDWFVQNAGPQAMDEWSFSQALGSKAAGVLEDHWNTWVTEADLDTLASVGVNHIRIPVGYWLFSPRQGNEPWVNTTQLSHLETMLGWMYKRNMRALIDMHAMPGSQNGDQSSGHMVSPPQWFSSANQNRSLAVIDAAIEWINQSPHKTVVSAFAPVNEPMGNMYVTDDRKATVKSFLQAVYPKLRAANLPMFWHHGFVKGPPDYWRDFASTMDPKYSVINDNPYPGFFPPKTDTDAVIASVCSNVQGWSGFPIPVVMTEWALSSGVHGTSWQKQYYNTQASAYAWSAGSFFWNFKMALTTTSPSVTGTDDSQQMEYSMLNMISKGIIPTNQNQTSVAYYQSLPNPGCGPIQFQTYGGN